MTNSPKGDATRGLSVIVPTLGRSPHLRQCLEALRTDGGAAIEIVVVAPWDLELTSQVPAANRLLRSGADGGFSAANNRALWSIDRPFVATVNDDAIVEPGWCHRLLKVLEARPLIAAAQGINLRLDDPRRIDGAGIGWNRWLQAVQLGRSRSVGEAALEDVYAIFGVSATAAIYRRKALDQVALGGGQIFDQALISYYEDVELACRLRGAGWQAALISTARARHAGSVTGSTLPAAGRGLIHGNRWRVLGRHLGQAAWRRAPKMLLRDLVDVGRLASAGDAEAAIGAAVGALAGTADGVAAGLTAARRPGGASCLGADLDHFGDDWPPNRRLDE